MAEVLERSATCGPLESCYSQHVDVGGMHWHLQRAGHGPVLLLLHGTGSASQSWRGLLPRLQQQFTVLAPDLPGHALSADPGVRGISLTGMAEGLRRLLDALALEPVWVIGHSAGAALAARMCLDGQLQPDGLIALNGALLPPLGMPLQLFSPLARLLAATPLLPELFAYRARHGDAVARLIGTTGSRLDADGLAFYAALMRRPGHVGAALRMMAWWDLAQLERDLPRLDCPLVQIVAEHDRTIPPSEALRVQALLPRSRVLRLNGLGHLAHEEDPSACLALIQPCLLQSRESAT